MIVEAVEGRFQRETTEHNSNELLGMSCLKKG